MERTRKGITAGLAIRAAAISTSIPIWWDTSSHGVSLSLFSEAMRGAGAESEIRAQPVFHTRLVAKGETNSFAVRYKLELGSTRSLESAVWKRRRGLAAGGS